MNPFFQKFLFVLGISCSFFVTGLILDGADGLKPLRRAEDGQAASLSDPEDFAASLSRAVNSPLNGPKLAEPAVKKSLPSRVPPPAVVPQDIIRGQLPQSGTDVLSERPPHPQGTVDAEVLDPKLLDDKLSETDSQEIQKILDGQETQPAKDAVVKEETASEDTESKSKQWANAVLLVVTIVTVMMLVYAVVIAYDYRQRWVQALMTQNSKLAMGSGFEDELTMK